MKNLKQRKIEELKQIFNSYEDYAGKSNLEKEIKAVSSKLTKEDAEKLSISFEQFKNHIFNLLANSRRVYVDFKKSKLEEIDDIFKELPELEEIEDIK